jgi:transposase InsO family protein
VSRSSTRRGSQFARRGIRIERVLRDNGACYRSSHFLIACRLTGTQAKKTRAHRRQTNGKAERFSEALIRGGACA